MPKIKEIPDTDRVLRWDIDHNLTNTIGAKQMEVFLKPGFAFEDGTTVKRFDTHENAIKAVNKSVEQSDK